LGDHKQGHRPNGDVCPDAARGVDHGQDPIGSPGVAELNPCSVSAPPRSARAAASRRAGGGGGGDHRCGAAPLFRTSASRAGDRGLAAHSTGAAVSVNDARGDRSARGALHLDECTAALPHGPQPTLDDRFNRARRRGGTALAASRHSRSVIPESPDHRELRRTAGRAPVRASPRSARSRAARRRAARVR